MAGADTPDREKIRHDLARSVIKDPLYDKIWPPDKMPKDPLRIIIEANDEYYLGKEQAFADVVKLVDEVAKANSELPAEGHQARSIGSDQNPYFKARLLPRTILDLVEKDYRNAQSHASKTSLAPAQVVRFLTIRRIWFDHPIGPLIDRSVSTVKADAARRAFLAEGKGIVWAVIDSGIDESHLHFSKIQALDVMLPVQHWDFTAGGEKGSDTAKVDRFGHGTHVAGIIAGAFSSDKLKGIARRTRLGTNDAIETFEEELSEIAGMAPSCKLVSLKVLDDDGQGEVSGIIAAIDKIQSMNDHGRNLKIHGVNLSVGYEFDPSWFACGQSPVCVEVNRLVRSGVVVVVAAGNTGYGVLSANQRATGGGMMLTINDPGNADLAITVGSTHRDSPHTYGVSYFSSKGPTGDGRMKPDLVAPGERILSCCSSHKPDNSEPNVYVEDNGTSMAAPHVSGVIAAFLSIRREYIGSPEKVKDLFLSTATDLGRNSYFQGRGLVDLMRAIQSV